MIDSPAFLTAASLAIACAVLSVFVVLRRWSFIGEGISHSSFGGAGTAWMLGLLFPWLEQSPIPYVAILVILFCFGTAITIGVITRRQRVQPDAAIGIFLVASLAWGFLAQNIYLQQRHGLPAGWDVFLFGRMEHISHQFAIGVVVMCVAVVVTVYLLRKEMIYCAFNPDMAETSGVPSGAIHYLTLLLLAIVVIIGVRVAGSVLVPALLILPGSIALLLTRKLSAVFTLAAISGLIGAVGGQVTHARWPFVPIGPAIVLTLFGLFVLAFVAKSFKRGA